MNSLVFRGDTARLGLGAASDAGGIRFGDQAVLLEVATLALVCCNLCPRLFLPDLLVSGDSLTRESSAKSGVFALSSLFFLYSKLTSIFSVRSSPIRFSEVFSDALSVRSTWSVKWQESSSNLSLAGNSDSCFSLEFLVPSPFISAATVCDSGFNLGDKTTCFPCSLLSNFGANRGIHDLHLDLLQVGDTASCNLEGFSTDDLFDAAVFGRVLAWGKLLGNRSSLVQILNPLIHSPWRQVKGGYENRNRGEFWLVHDKIQAATIVVKKKKKNHEILLI